MGNEMISPYALNVTSPLQTEYYAEPPQNGMGSHCQRTMRNVGLLRSFARIPRLCVPSAINHLERCSDSLHVPLWDGVAFKALISSTCRLSHRSVKVQHKG